LKGLKPISLQNVNDKVRQGDCFDSTNSKVRRFLFLGCQFEAFEAFSQFEAFNQFEAFSQFEGSLFLGCL